MRTRAAASAKVNRDPSRCARIARPIIAGAAIQRVTAIAACQRIRAAIAQQAIRTATTKYAFKPGQNIIAMAAAKAATGQTAAGARSKVNRDRA